MAQRLSIVMIVRNEAALLGSTLLTIKGHVDEIVVVDTGSTDATVAIATKHGAKVIDEVWRDDFSAARNVALANATGDYCLTLDADEVVTPDSWIHLRAFMTSNAQALGLVTIVSETRTGRSSELITRVCRRDGKSKFVGRIHEQLIGDGTPTATGAVILHAGYTESMMKARDKFARNLRMLEQEHTERPDDPYILYQLGRTRWHQDKSDEAAMQLTDALVATPRNAFYLPALVRDLGYVLKERCAYNDALALVRAYREQYPKYTDLVFLEGLIGMEIGDEAMMRNAFETCLTMGEASGYSSVLGVGSFLAQFNLGLFHELAENTAVARRHYEMALRIAPDFQQARERLAALPVTR